MSGSYEPHVVSEMLQDLFGKGDGSTLAAFGICPICKNSDKIAMKCLKCGRKPK